MTDHEETGDQEKQDGHKTEGRPQLLNVFPGEGLREAAEYAGYSADSENADDKAERSEQPVFRKQFFPGEYLDQVTESPCC